jgi:nucleoside-diphosphate-sugar epimerase
MRALVTGATGLVGFETMDALRRAGAAEVIGTSRAHSAAEAATVAWDMAAEPPPVELREPWDVIVHSAADTRWTMEPGEARAANVDTVRALVPLVRSHTRVVHVSTAYSTGLTGSTESEDLGDYRNTYEWSKANAERLVRSTFPRFTIVRPPLIIGRSSDGRAARFTGMYTMLRAITASMVPVIVADADAYFEVVPVDAVADVIVEACWDAADGKTLIVAGGRDALRVGAAVESMTRALNAWRKARGHEPFEVPRLISRESWNRFFFPFVCDQLSARQRRILDLLSNFEPYLEVHEALEPTHPVGDVQGAIFAAARYWADAESRRASMAPRPWTAAPQADSTVREAQATAIATEGGIR